MWRDISKDFSLADHILLTRPELAWQKMTQPPLNGTTQPVEVEKEGRIKSIHGQTMVEIKKYLIQSLCDTDRSPRKNSPQTHSNALSLLTHRPEL